MRKNKKQKTNLSSSLCLPDFPFPAKKKKKRAHSNISIPSRSLQLPPLQLRTQNQNTSRRQADPAWDLHLLSALRGTSTTTPFGWHEQFPRSFSYQFSFYSLSLQAGTWGAKVGRVSAFLNVYLLAIEVHIDQMIPGTDAKLQLWQSLWKPGICAQRVSKGFWMGRGTREAFYEKGSLSWHLTDNSGD